MEAWELLYQPNAATLAMEENSRAYLQAYPIEPAVYGAGQTVVWDGGNNAACYGTAISLGATVAATTAMCASAETGIGAVACAAGFAATAGQTMSTAAACYGANAGANNGNGSAGPGGY
jgi:hypothetical protein